MAFSYSPVSKQVSVEVFKADCRGWGPFARSKSPMHTRSVVVNGEAKTIGGGGSKDGSGKRRDRWNSGQSDMTDGDSNRTIDRFSNRNHKKIVSARAATVDGIGIDNHGNADRVDSRKEKETKTKTEAGLMAKAHTSIEQGFGADIGASTTTTAPQSTFSTSTISYDDPRTRNSTTSSTNAGTRISLQTKSHKARPSSVVTKTNKSASHYRMAYSFSGSDSGVNVSEELPPIFIVDDNSVCINAAQGKAIGSASSNNGASTATTVATTTDGIDGDVDEVSVPPLPLPVESKLEPQQGSKKEKAYRRLMQNQIFLGMVASRPQHRPEVGAHLLSLYL